MRYLLITALVMLFAGCTPKAPDVMTTPEKATNTGRSNQAAENAFADLECTLDGSCPQESTSTQTSGDAEYDRQNAAANSAFHELDCEAAGGTDCSQTSTPPATVDEKARPGSTLSDKPLERGVSKYPMKDGYPVWFSYPGYDGYIGGVGIAKPQKNGYSVQRRVATVQAQADLARSVKVNVYNEFTSERLLVSKNTQQHYQEKFSTLSRQQVDDFIGNAVIMDEWLDEKTGELYIWVVLPK